MITRTPPLSRVDESNGLAYCESSAHQNGPKPPAVVRVFTEFGAGESAVADSRYACQRCLLGMASSVARNAGAQGAMMHVRRFG